MYCSGTCQNRAKHVRAQLRDGQANSTIASQTAGVNQHQGVDHIDTLADLGLTRDESSVFQRLALVEVISALAGVAMTIATPQGWEIAAGVRGGLSA